QLARGGHEPLVGQPLTGPLDARVGERRPQASGMAEELVEPLERLGGQRVLVVDLARADGGEGRLVLAGPSGLPVVDQRVNGSFVHCVAVSNTGSPSSGVEASA